MMTKANNNDLRCCLCGQIYKNPILLSPCGHAFDRDCILRHTACPIGYCNAPVHENYLMPNNLVKTMIDRQNQLTNYAYEMFLLDTSTSMWYSDSMFGLIGASRFTMAKKFIKEIFEQRWNSSTHQISLITFDTNPIEQFPFEIVRQNHLQTLQDLQPNGAYTALFDAIKFCLEKFEKLNEILARSTVQCLYILTDGADNFSSSGNRQHYIDYIRGRSKKLNILGHIIQVGDKNLSEAKQLCDEIDYKFYHFNNGNVPQAVNSFVSSTNQYTKDLENKINELPNACTTPIRRVTNQKRVGVLA